MGFFDIFKKKDKSIKTKKVARYKFNFEKYPDLVPLYVTYRNMRKQVVKHSMKDTNISAKNMIDIKKEKDNYSRTVLARAIYEIFNKEKPLLYNADEKFSLKWDEHFRNKSFEELDNDLRDDLVGLIDGNFIYELPNEYYKN